MKHHFADFLDREGNYWKLVPNRERYAYRIGNQSVSDEKITITTIGDADSDWKRVFELPNLEELTLHQPSKEQLHGIEELSKLKRLRITHARPTDISFISSLTNIEELVLEYVSGFSDLSPLRNLPKLRALHIENLRKVERFDGLAGIQSLKYLHIDGTLDWKQPITDFEFLSGLPNLEVLSFSQIINRSPFPALFPALGLKKLKKLRLTWTMLATEEYALLETGLPNVDGTEWGPFRRFSYSTGDDWFEFTGKRAGRAKCGHPDAERKCEAFAKKYNAMKEEAKKIIENRGRMHFFPT